MRRDLPGSIAGWERGDRCTGRPLYWVDAFAERPFAGNPAAVCLLEGPAEEGWMQALAAEMGISETAFLWPEADLLSLRWFTPTSEVDLCGHATVAAAHALRAAGRAADGETISFVTRSGVLGARLDGDLIELDLPAEQRRRRCRCPKRCRGWRRWRRPADAGGLLVELADADAVRRLWSTSLRLATLDVRALYVTAVAGDGGRLRAAGLRSGRGDRRGPGHRFGPVSARALLGRPTGAHRPLGRPSSRRGAGG